MAAFQTWWLINGPKLPERELLIPPNIVIAPLSDQDFENLAKDIRAPVPTLRPPGEFCTIHYPPRDDVKSRWRLQIDIDADTEDDAIAKAKLVADRLLVSFSLLVPGLRYTAELRKFRQFGRVGERSDWSETLAVKVYDKPAPLDDELADKALRLMTAFQASAPATEAYIHLLTAWQLQETVGSKPLDRSILQHYVLSFETICVAVMSKVRAEKADSIRLAERSFADEFARSFAGRADKPKAIREASTRLRELSYVNMLPALAMTAEKLGISQRVLDNAVALYRLRSTTLSHAGKNASDKMRQWLFVEGASISLADEVAREFLAKYCAYKTS